MINEQQKPNRKWCHHWKSDVPCGLVLYNVLAPAFYTSNSFWAPFKSFPRYRTFQLLLLLCIKIYRKALWVWKAARDPGTDVRSQGRSQEAWSGLVQRLTHKSQNVRWVQRVLSGPERRYKELQDTESKSKRHSQVWGGGRGPGSQEAQGWSRESLRKAGSSDESCCWSKLVFELIELRVGVYL